jgi:hypothetical protein
LKGKIALAWHFFWLTVAVGFLVLGVRGAAAAEQLTHTVVHGDTLWDLCEKYYGDPELWPKLWQMNPFITNPHLLRPGDEITLLEGLALQEKPRAAEPQPPPPLEPEKGIDASGMTNIDSIGFLSRGSLDAAGQIIGISDSKVLLSAGDRVYAKLEDKELRSERLGQRYLICRASAPLEHPSSGAMLGRAVSVLGQIEIIKYTGKMVYEGKILKSYRSVQNGDTLVARKPVSPCIRPVPFEDQLATQIVAIKDLREIVGQFSIVYLADGSASGIRRGHLFEVFEEKMLGQDTGGVQVNNVLGHVLVLESSQDTATGVVVTMRREFYNGAMLKSAGRTISREVLAAIPECELD